MLQDNVQLLFQCDCGAAGRPIEAHMEGEPVATRVFCDSCWAKTEAVLAKVKPIYAAMRLAGIGEEIAAETLAFMLDRMDRGGAALGLLW